VALGYGLTLLVLAALEDRLLFHPAPAARRWAEPPPGFEVEDVTFQTADGTPLHGRWFPCSGARGAVLVCHSRAGNLSLELSAEHLAGWHREVGVSVFVFDYPGYGRSGGRPSEAGCYAAADAAYDSLTRRVGPRDVLLFGRSLGSAVAVDLACRRPHRALVLVSPFTSIPAVVQRLYPVLPARALMRNRFDSAAKVGRCRRPLLVVHGTHDRLVPFAEGERLFAAANEPKRFLPVAGARHDDSVLTDFFPELGRFLAETAP
jgi:alpha-beta hydrolase superfamily lysophospholipase